MDVTKIVEMVSHADTLSQQAKQRAAESAELLASAQKKCPHSSTMTQTTEREDEYGKVISHGARTTCTICRKIIVDN